MIALNLFSRCWKCTVGASQFSVQELTSRNIVSLINQAKVDLQEDEGQKNGQPPTAA